MVRMKLDFHVVPKRKMFGLHGRRSEWDGSAWQPVDDWYLWSYGTLEEAQRQASEKTHRLGWEKDFA